MKNSVKPKISIITLGVKDLKKATSFYQNLGFKLQKNSNAEISFFKQKGTWLSLFPIGLLAKDAKQKYKKISFRGFTLACNFKTMEEVNKFLVKAEKIGGIVVKKPQKTDWGGYSGYFQDLDGYLWEIAYNPHFWIK